ncbi:MAG: DUF4365 domain-containing protein [Bacteroidetes bacterium]|nr:DUF4365 domain-containing protein [Bacteroidota bacterium]
MDRNFEVEQTSINILKTLLPSGWRFREQHPDYNIDYFVEIPPGIFFGVQLKGRRKLIQKENHIKIQFSTKQLKYYFDDIKSFPVFIILVDIIKSNVYWLFIQEYLNEKIVNKHWRIQKNVTLTINTKNTIENIEVFKKIIVKANNYMKELWPPSLFASVKKETEYFRSLDPRFKKISININNNENKYTINYLFHSDESFNLKFKIKKGNKLNELLKNTTNDKLILDSQDVDVTGSDLLKEIFKRSDKIEFKLNKPELDVDLYLQIMNEKDNIIEYLHLKGHLFYNDKIIKINSTQKDSSFNINLIYDRNEKKNPVFNFKFNFTSWMNKDIQFLPFYDKLYSFFHKINDGKNVIFKTEYMGKPLFTAQLKLSNNLAFLDFAKKMLLFIKKLKYIDSYFNLKLLCPDLEKLKKDDIYDVDELYDLITKGEHIEKNRKFTVNIEVKRKKDYLELFSKSTNITLHFDGPYTLLGKKINIGEFEVDISRPKLLISNVKMQELFRSNKKYILLKFTTDEKSRVLIRKLNKKS